MYCFIFFFFKQKTAYEMRIRYWSSDVGSSDLFGREKVGHPLDQKPAEADSDQASLRVGDGIEDRSVGIARLQHRGFRIEQRRDVVRHAVDQRHLDEDQRFVRHAWMEEGEAAAVGDRKSAGWGEGGAVGV